MRTAAVGASLLASVVLCTIVTGQLTGGGSATKAASGSGMIALSSMVGDCQQVTVIDPELRAMAVYHIDGKGGIVFKGVRQLHYDLQMLEYNTSPSPRDIRASLEQR